MRIAKFFSSLAYDRNLNVIHLSLKHNIQVIVLFHTNGFLQIMRGDSRHLFRYVCVDAEGRWETTSSQSILAVSSPGTGVLLWILSKSHPAITIKKGLFKPDSKIEFCVIFV